MAEKPPRFGPKPQPYSLTCETPEEGPSEGEETMDFRTHEAARVREQAEALTRHYRSIGPAAILAALLFRRPAHKAMPSR